MDSGLETLPPELEKFWRVDDGLTAVQRAEAFGIELSLLEENTRQSPLERVELNDALVNQALELRAALTNSYAKS